MTLLLFITNLGGKVEPQVAVVGEGVLDKQGNFIRQAQLDPVRKTAGLAEVDEVLEGECECYGLAHGDFDVLIRLLNVAVLTESDRSGTNVSVALEADTLLCAFNGHWAELAGSGKGRYHKENLPDSERAERSLQIRWNSAAGISMDAAYSVSGIPKCS